MSFLEQARRFDRDDQPERAAQSYEAHLANGDASLDTYLDLAVLYFECNDGGYAAHHRLTVAFLDVAWTRMFELLDEADVTFGNRPEIEFWRRYFRFILLGEDWMTADECLALTRSGETLVPYFYLLGSFAGLGQDEARKYEQRAQALLELVGHRTTARARYVASVLESAFARFMPERSGESNLDT